MDGQTEVCNKVPNDVFYHQFICTANKKPSLVLGLKGPKSKRQPSAGFDMIIFGPMLAK